MIKPASPGRRLHGSGFAVGGTGVAVGGTGVAVCVGRGVAVLVDVGVIVGVFVGVRVLVGVAVGVQVLVGKGVFVGVDVGVCARARTLGPSAMANTEAKRHKAIPRITTTNMVLEGRATDPALLFIATFCAPVETIFNVNVTGPI